MANDMNLFMMCASPDRRAMSGLPAGFSVRSLRTGEYEAWRDLHIAEPEKRDAYVELLDGFFRDVYASKGDLFFRQCRIICDDAGKIVGTCLIWKAYESFNTLHWLKVLPAYEGRGLGRALLTRVLSELGADEYPVYLHTHATCDRAIKLYTDFGFRLLTDARIGARENDLRDALPILKARMPGCAYDRLAFAEADERFLGAVCAGAADEF